MAEELKPSYSFSNDRLNELARLFPEVFEDGKVNTDTLKELIGVHSSDANEKEHFGLNWVGKRDARQIAAKAPTGTLKPCFGEGVNEDITENIFIEGENLEVLKILRKAYAEKIRMIYIDPPYNTGNDFIYKDDFSDSTEDYLRKSGEASDEGLLVSNPKSSGKYHANWLSFMYPRLKVAKDLLTPDGVIFISIDDTEVHHLKLMMNELFGEENFIQDFIWKKSYGGGAKTKHVVNLHEYILFYAKDKANIGVLELPPSDDVLKYYKWQDDKFDLRGPYRKQPLATNSMDERPNLRYAIIYEGEEIWPEKQWQWSKERAYKALENNELVLSKKKDGWSVEYKQYLKDEDGIVRGAKPYSILDGPYIQIGTNEISELFGNGKVFTFPKPSLLIEKLIELVDKDSIILDFFAGSGSTAHAVYSLNKRDGGNRKFICVQIPDKIESEQEAFKIGFKSLSSLCLDRIKRVVKANAIKDGVKFFKLSKSSIFKWNDFDPNRNGGTFEFSTQLELSLKNPLIDGVNHPDLITEIQLLEGFPLTSKEESLLGEIVRVTSNDVPYALYISWANKLDAEVINTLDLKETDHFVCLDKAFGSNNSLKQTLDNRCKLFTI